jgi:hypothetical protein
MDDNPRKIFVCLFLFISSVVYAFDDFILKWDLPNFGFGTNIFQNGSDNIESFIDAGTIGIEHIKTRIGLEYSPYKNWNWDFMENNNEFSTERHSFLNFNIYWNAFDIIFLGELLKISGGPFSKINYLHYDGNIPKNNEFVYTAGFRFWIAGNTMEVWNLNWNILGTEFGYRNINGKNAFFVGVNIDITFFIIVLIASATNSESKSD